VLINKLQLSLITILLLLIPFHTLVIANIIDISVLNLWKEGILFLLIGLFLLNFSITNKFDFIDLFIVLTVVYFIFITSLSFFSISSLYGLRNLIEPLLFLLVVRNVKVSGKFFRELIRLLVLIAFFISLFGIFQCLYLGDQFLLDLGYSSGSNGGLHHSFYFSGGILQRNVGTFSSPNDFGFFLTVVIVMLDYYKIFKKKSVLWLMNVVLYFSLFLTFSRSAILGLALYLFVNNLKKCLKIICLFVLVFSLLNFLFPELLLTINRFLSLTFSGKDPSIKGHLDSLLFSIDLVKENFLFGLEMGRVGPKASLYFNTLIDVESSFFCLLLDVGFVGFLLYIISFIPLMNNKLVLLLLLSVFPALFLLPMIYELEVMLILYGLIGLISIKNNKGMDI
tara:strand:+ start:1203 stop:2387 length:1185 start_codon:yes stop_codon:yes gene_type:complete